MPSSRRPAGKTPQKALTMTRAERSKTSSITAQQARNQLSCDAVGMTTSTAARRQRLAPDHQHRLKDEAYCRELMALTTYRLRDVVQNADGHWLRVGCERAATGCVPLAPGEKRNLGQKNETRARKPGFLALFLSFYREGGRKGTAGKFLGLANNSFAPHR